MTGATARSDERGPSLCRHCSAPLPSVRFDEFCCAGCRAVSQMLATQGLSARFYALGGGRGAPARGAEAARDHLWLEALVAALPERRRVARVTLDVQGVHCSACVWAFEELFTRHRGALEIIVDPTLGRVTLDVSPEFELPRYVSEVESLGYVLGPPNKSAEATTTTLVVRTGVAVAIAMNVMSFALAEYFGLAEEPLLGTLRALSVALAALSVAVGAPPFVRGALGGLRARVLTLDVPIALGMALVALGTLHAFFTTGDAAYADTLAVFVALMLGGRLLEERSLSVARQRLIDVGAAPKLWVRRVTREALEVALAADVRAGDTLLVACGEVVPVDAQLESERGTIALDWVSGESEPIELELAATVVAGALNRGDTPLLVRATADYDASALRAILERPVSSKADAAGLESGLGRYWTAGVLVAASATLAAWGLAGDWVSGLRATTAVLVVTCPCAIGIATPLGRELARARLRAQGLFVRTSRTLGRAARVTRVVFDKTGTLSTGHLEVRDARPLLSLPLADRRAVASIVAQSAHPRSAAVRRALEHVAADPNVRVAEATGHGLRAELDGHSWRVGSPSWAGGGTGDVVVSRDGEVLADLETDERLRGDAAFEIAALRTRGLEVFVLSGDKRARALALAERAGIEPAHVVGDATPEDKARWLLEHDADRTLFIGDGLNDLPAASVASLSGTPAIDRPFLPARTDFHFTSAGLSPIRSLLEIAHSLERVARRNTALALVYNVVAVSIAASGMMHPWLAAVLMPLSSLLLIGSTALALSGARDDRAQLSPISTEIANEGALAWKS